MCQEAEALREELAYARDEIAKWQERARKAEVARQQAQEWLDKFQGLAAEAEIRALRSRGAEGKRGKGK